MKLTRSSQVSLCRLDEETVLLSARDGDRAVTLAITPAIAEMVGQELLRLVEHTAGARSGAFLTETMAASGSVPKPLREALEQAWREMPKIPRAAPYVVEIARLRD